MVFKLLVDLQYHLSFISSKIFYCFIIFCLFNFLFSIYNIIIILHNFLIIFETMLNIRSPFLKIGLSIPYTFFLHQIFRSFLFILFRFFKCYWFNLILLDICFLLILLMFYYFLSMFSHLLLKLFCCLIRLSKKRLLQF